MPILDGYVGFPEGTTISMMTYSISTIVRIIAGWILLIRWPEMRRVWDNFSDNYPKIAHISLFHIVGGYLQNMFGGLEHECYFPIYLE